LGLAQSRGAEQTRSITLQLGELLAAGKITQANSILKQHLSDHTPSAQTFFEVGRVYFEHDQWEQTAQLLRKSIELQSQNDVAHLLLGLSLAELKQYDESERELQTAVQQNPRSDFNWYFAGWRLLLRGKYEASLPYFYKAVELNPRNPNAQRALGSALARTGSYGLAENYFKKAIELIEQQQEPNPEPYLDLTYLLLFSNQKASATQALEFARKAITMNPKMAEAHYLCGKALLKLERFTEARSELLLAVQLNAKDARPHFLLGQVYDRLGESQQAVEARKTFAKLSQRRADEAQGMGDLRP
jgi:tetratricopeptide (TPR) repeat protein